ncbi:MAG: hypothetical protein QOK42_144 [Frankiaceae bacterium]|nr:hypothetical protein [Frankiaceae bacterium]MDX6272916.1 hypothetical protein [Frankiales bacterium]
MRGSTDGREGASRRVRTLTVAAGIGTVLASAALTAALVPTTPSIAGSSRAAQTTTDNSTTGTAPTSTDRQPVTSSGGS